MPWESVSDFGIKLVGELRATLTAAIASGKLKHKFYRIDHGKSPYETTIPGSMNHSEGATVAKKKKQVKADKSIVDAIKDAKEIKKDLAAGKTEKKVKQVHEPKNKDKDGIGVVAAIREEIGEGERRSGIDRPAGNTKLDRPFPGLKKSRG